MKTLDHDRRSPSMASIAGRTRSRRSLSERSESGCRSRPRRAAAVPPPQWKNPVVVINDDDDDEEEEEERIELRSRRSRPRFEKERRQSSEETLLSWDRRAVVVSESDDRSSEGSVEFRKGSSRLEGNESSESLIRFETEEIEEECGSKGSLESSVRFVEEDSGDDDEASKYCSLKEKSDFWRTPVDNGKEEEVEEGEAEPTVKSSFFCVARRTRTQVGKQDRVSYAEYFMEKFSDDSEDEVKEEGEVKEEEEERGESYRVTDNAMAEKSESTSVEGRVGEDGEIFVKKKKLGLEILVSVRNEKTESEGAMSTGSIGVSQRTRSRFNLVPDGKMKMGTVSNPYCLDVDELESEPDSPLPSDNGENDMDADNNVMDLYGQKGKRIGKKSYGGSRMDTRVSNGVGDGNRVKLDQKERRDGDSGSRMDVNDNVDGRDDVDGKEETEKGGGQAGTSKKRKRVQAPKANDLFKILADTIWNDDKSLPEELVKGTSPVEDGSASRHKELLPLVFSFGNDDEKPVEKSEQEKELDELWAAFDFAMGADNIGVYHGDEGQTEEISVPEVESDPSIFCSKGKHQFILDEQIGIRCKFCSFVEMDIKHIFPSWASHFGERVARQDTVNKDVPLFVNDLFANGKDDDRKGSHGCSGTVWDLIPELRETMFQHQQEAFEFMWRNLAGGIRINELKSCVGSDGTGGCVISHAPGTGKTRLAICFIQSYMKVFPECRPVIVAHRGLMQTWKNEFKKWGVNLSIHDLNASKYSGQEDGMVLKLASKEHNQDMTLMRLVKLYSWGKGNSVILVSYSLFATIYCSDKDLRCSRLKKILLEKPGLIIFDEGHTPRNERSLIWKALEKIKTSKRVILSGTPFQNNFLELYTTLCLVRPKFADKISARTSKLGQTKREELFATKEEMFQERKEAKSKWVYLTKSVTGYSKELEEVKTIIKPFVHVHSGRILDTLPGSRKCIIELNPFPQQKSFLELMKDIKSSSALDNDYRNSLLSIHPSLAMVFLSEKEKSLVDTPMLEKLRINPHEGVKTKFVIELIRLCEALKEKVLVFCQYIEPLEMIKDQLVKLFEWTEGKEVLKMDGKIPTKNRQSVIDIFNDLTSEARVLLASTKACSEGISLVGASRVVLIDVLWNPSMEHQAISRAYRIGQGKFVYIYQLITFGTGEDAKHGVQATKDKFSKLVFSPGIDPNSVEASSSYAEEECTSKLVAEDKILEEMIGHESLKDMFLKISYPPKESNTMDVFSEEDLNQANTVHA